MELDVSGDHGHLFHVVLHASPVIAIATLVQMLDSVFGTPHDAALVRLADLATRGRAILLTCERPQAEYGRRQLEAYCASRPGTPMPKLTVERVYARPN